MSRRIALVFCLILLVGTPVAAQNPLLSPPNDPDANKQWVIRQLGLTCAWEHLTGSSDVTVAVIDSGVDMNHPDLVDILRTDGFDAVDGDDDPSDENGHGTHVSGIIAATINNSKGIAGVAGGGTRILPIRVMAADGSGSNQDIIAGIRYAVSKNVQIINMSLGSMLPLDSEDIVAAIQEADAAGVLVIIAAGNSFVPLPNFAFGVEEFAMVVAATDPEDRKTDFSNYGNWISVSAPGAGIYSTMPTYDVYMTRDLPAEERFNKNYDQMSGTSQATPVVAGLAALLFAQHPDWNADQVRAEIEKTADDISAQNPIKRYGPVTYFEPSNLGTGRINACNALGGPIKGSAAAVGGPEAKSNLIRLLGFSAVMLVVLGGLTVFLVRRRKQNSRPRAIPAGGFAPPPPIQYDQAMQQPMYDQRNLASQPIVGSTPPLSQSYAPPSAAPAAGGPAWGKLTVVRGAELNKFYLLRDNQVFIGREAGLAIAISGDSTVSRRHTILYRDPRGIEIEDAGSSHGTKINGIPVQGRQLVRPGDVIEVGQTHLRFEG
ncbi:S8 family serine peptidase [Herpetosiphon llansteffanensis]